MLRQLILPLLAAGAFTFMGVHIAKTHQAVPDRPPVVTPAKAPFASRLAGAGLIESRSENIAIAAPVSGVVSEVCVMEGERVQAGDILFRIDDRDRRADLDVAQAQLASANAELVRLQKLPRAEDIPPSEAKVARAKADLAAVADQLKRSEHLFKTRVVSEEDLIARRQAVASAKEVVAQAEAEHARLMAGAWEQELSIAEAQVAQAQARVSQARVEIDRMVVRAPSDGDVLRVDIRPGEYVGTPPGETVLILGDLERLHVRVDLDEHDLPRFRPGMKGVAFLRGDTQTRMPITFVRIEPYVMPKKSLTGASTERTDTRVLQVIYELVEKHPTAFVGQQVDVFLESAESKPMEMGKQQ